MYKMIKPIINVLKNMRKNKLNLLIFFVTSRCNSRCKTCFYFDKINKNDDLGFEEIERISVKTPPFDEILLSGGEPFLREDLVDIIGLFIKNNGIKAVVIPTNGILPEKIKTTVLNIIDNYPNLNILISFSLDGAEGTNDRIRGIRGAFQKTIESIKSIQKLLNVYPQLSININTVICFDNFQQIPKLIEFLEKNNLKTIGHSFEIIRGNVFDSSIKQIPVDELRKIYNKILSYKEKVFSEKVKDYPFKTILRAMHYANIALLYTRQFKNYQSFQRWGFPCAVKNQRVAVIEHNGLVKLCELKEDIGTLRDNDYNFTAIWNSRLAQKRRDESRGCSCTHICFILQSIYDSYFAMFVLMPIFFVKYFINRRI